MAGRFVAVPASELYATIESIGEAVKSVGGDWSEYHQGRERVFTLSPPKRDTQVRIFSSLSVNAAEVRGCGNDAVRLVHGYVITTEDGYVFKPLSEGRRIYRTAPASLSEPARVAAFLERLRTALREIYRDAARTPRCPRCTVQGRGSVLVHKRGSRGVFVGCSAYPKCAFTRDMSAASVR